ncbi:MAG: hypothetical protein DHS20C15_32260 [Planctomycetota bacterium]|nr:MAG: hypothetical protein DHS20C15_32260 [Planctomycetota bacterium]
MILRTALLLVLLVCSSVSAQVPVAKNLGATLSEDERVAAALERSLGAFLAEARNGQFSEACVEPGQLERYSFFFKGLSGLGQREGDSPPSLLKSYPLDDARYSVTVAFAGVRDGAPFISKIVELEASPHGEGYRFGCPFEAKTADFRTKTLGSVTFHSSGALDEQAAAEFVRFKEAFSDLTKAQDRHLDYYCFRSLDELLQSYGFVFDAGKCNFLKCDLGFTDDGGRAYLTGTDNPNYTFEYVGEFLAHSLPRSEELYGPFVNGMSAYYGGYALSGDDMQTLRAQFRARLAAEPEIDFLHEYKQGRSSSVNRHFTHYVIGAFLCEEVVEQHGFDRALQLLRSGADGERFFANIQDILGVDEDGFHALILRLIDAEPA